MNIENPEQFDLFDDLIDSFVVDNKLALKFFLVFAWFEHLLKIFEYFKDKGYVSIKWIEFGNELDERFDSERTPELKKAVTLLLDEVKSQRVENDQIVWKDIDLHKDATTELGKILFWVKTVRNNIFHGGKFYRFRERDVKLLRNCLVILRELVDIHGDLAYVYEEQISGRI